MKTAIPTAEEEEERTLEVKPFQYESYFAWRSGGKVEDGQTPLHRAAYWGHDEVARLLMGRGALVEARDARNQSPRDLAMARGHRELADRLRS